MPLFPKMQSFVGAAQREYILCLNVVYFLGAAAEWILLNDDYKGV